MKDLYMIGNSHIDPVWFWTWEEGMQEVKATLSSALDRMEEYPEFRFTCSSTAFLEWIERIDPELFSRLKERIQEGRMELVGGWFIEPDCLLPCGEAFVRQGLYGQRYFQEKFGVTCRTGSNVDSFGHNSMLPQILKKSGMDEYVFMRPRLDTPVFVWESKDGSQVNAISLPSEYTTWFYEPTKEAVEMADEAAKKAELFDVYRGARLGAGKKSMALHITFSSEDKAITPETADGWFQKIVLSLGKHLGGELR